MDSRVLQVLEKAGQSPEGPEAALVFADALLEAGDPYGQFIVRSVRGEEELARSLRRKHEKDWLGPLKPFLTDLEYRHGLLHSAAYARRAPEDPMLAREAASHPMLGALRRLVREKSPTQRINRAGVEAYLQFVTSPTARALREVDGSDPEILEALAGLGGLKVTRLHDVRLNQPTLKLLAREDFDPVDWVEVTLQGHHFESALQKLGTHEAFQRRPREVCFHFTTSNARQCDQLAIEAWSGLKLAALEVWEQTLRRTPEGTTVVFRSTSFGGGDCYRGELQNDPFWAGLLAYRVKDLRRVVFAGLQPERWVLQKARQLLPGVRFELEDGSEPVGRERDAAPPPPPPAPPPRAARGQRGAPPPPRQGVDPEVAERAAEVMGFVRRGDFGQAADAWARIYAVPRDEAVKKVNQLSRQMGF